jgi:hypothetical protein
MPSRPRTREAAFLIAASPPPTGREVRMWSEWLLRTLNPRRAEAAPEAARELKPLFAAPPEFEGDGMHPGADEFRAALDRLELE